MTGGVQLFYFQWHITDACNLRCIHCYQDCNSRTEIDEAGIETVLCQVSKTMRKWNMLAEIGLTGGEPLVHPRFAEIVECLDELDVVSTYCIMTNGTLIDDSISNWLRARRRLSFVQVSLDGTTRTVHDAIRGSGAFDAALSGVAALTRAGIQTRLMYTVSSVNANDAVRLPAFARELGVGGFSIDRVVPCGSGSSLQQQMLSPHATRDLFLALEEAYRSVVSPSLPLGFARNRPLWVLVPSSEGQLGGCCSAGFNGICIMPDLGVQPCRRLTVRVGSLKSETLFKIWYTSDVLHALRDRRRLKGKCHDCEYVFACGGCRAIAFSVSKDFLAEDPQCWKDNSTI